MAERPNLPFFVLSSGEIKLDALNTRTVVFLNSIFGLGEEIQLFFAVALSDSFVQSTLAERVHHSKQWQPIGDVSSASWSPLASCSSVVPSDAYSDPNTVLASLHTFGVTAGCPATTFQRRSDRVLAILLIYVNSFLTAEYVLNSRVVNNLAVVTGKYPEDVYRGGNEWSDAFQ